MSYHYGQTIREHRIACKMTLEQLAAKWPTKETGVNARYVIDIEAGKKHITDVETLRKLATILNIPLWKLGLNEYDPFNENGPITSTFFDLNALSELIQDIWYLRLYAPLEVAEHKIMKLSRAFFDLIHNNSRLLHDKDFMILYAQVKRLEEVIYTERHEYTTSLQYAHDMLEVAKLSGDTKTEAIALTRIGVELLRNENKEALPYLEEARDRSFTTSSKEVGAYCYSMLARGYATFRDERRFIQASQTSIALAEAMQGLPVTTKDHVYHAHSAILEEHTNGLILFGRGEEALASLEAIEDEVKIENNTYLAMWIPLDYAQSYLALGEVEQSIHSLEAFHNHIKEYNSPRLNSTIIKHLSELDVLGYGDVPSVRGFKKNYHLS